MTTYHDDVGVASIVGNTDFCLLSDIVDRVGLWGLERSRNEDRAEELQVQVVVGEDHAVVNAGTRAGAVDVAVEEVVFSRRKRGFDVSIEV